MHLRDGGIDEFCYLEPPSPSQHEQQCIDGTTTSSTAAFSRPVAPARGSEFDVATRRPVGACHPARAEPNAVLSTMSARESSPTMSIRV
jgi:hypothetical protein